QTISGPPLARGTVSLCPKNKRSIGEVIKSYSQRQTVQARKPRLNFCGKARSAPRKTRALFWTKRALKTRLRPAPPASCRSRGPGQRPFELLRRPELVRAKILEVQDLIREDLREALRIS